MKKIITSTMIIIIVICLCFTSTGCMDFLFSALGLGSDDSESENNKIVLQIHVNEETLSVNAYEDEQVTIEKLAIKQGYYLTGYFDAPEGGTKYFDSNGNSLSVWSKSNPIEFYAQWGGIDNYVLCENLVWSKNYYKFYSNTYFTIILNDGDEISAIAGNLSRKIHLSINFKMSCPDYKTWDCSLYIVDDDTSAGEIHNKTYFTLNGSEYNTFSFEMDVSAKAFSKGTQNGKTVYRTHLKFNGSNVYPSYVKDLSVSAYFVPQDI